MKSTGKIKLWRDSQHLKWQGVLRISLGLTLIWKGLLFITNPDVLITFLRETGITDQIGTSVLITTAAQLIIILHLVGGLCIAFGINTRLVCLLNLPALFGAVLFVNLNGNLLKQYSTLWLSVPVLLALTYFSIKGDGAFVIDGEPDKVL